MAASSANTRRATCAVLGVAVACVFIVLLPDVGLRPEGVRCLGILLGAIVWWVGGVLPEFATGFIMVALFAVLCGVDVSVSLSACSTPIWWLLVAAFALGAGMKTSGLMRRMAQGILRKFPHTFAAQVIGFMAAGTIIGPLIPSVAAKGTLLAPLAMSVGDALGYERRGRQMDGLFLSVVVGVRTIAVGAISASITGYAFLAVLPAEVQSQFNMLYWFGALLPWLVVVLVLNTVALIVLYRPKGEEHDGSDEVILEDLGPMAAKEKRMLAIIVTVVALWVLEPLHGISTTIIGLASVAAMAACGVLDGKTFRTEVNWTSLIFIGTTMSLSAVFKQLGVEEWIMACAQPLFAAIATSPYMLVIGIGLLTLAIRFLIVSEIAYINIVMPFLVPLAMGLGINPWVTAIAAYALLNPWFVLYQSNMYIAIYYSVGGEMTTQSQAAKYCFIYTATCFIGLIASVPVWQMMGLFG